MKINLVRTQMGKDATNGLLFINGIFECYTLEDQYQAKKVYGETCVPEGTYEITLRTVGGFHEHYKKKYSWHKGMLWIRNIPEFEYVLFHLGNTDENTAGCVLVGNTQQDLDVSKDGFIGSSGDAYKNFYPKVAKELLQGNKVTLEITQINFDPAEKINNKTGSDYVNAGQIMEKLSEINGNVKKLDAKIGGKNII